jgi:hypothetical protein
LRVPECGAECSNHVYRTDDVGYQGADCLHSDCCSLFLADSREREREERRVEKRLTPCRA